MFGGQLRLINETIAAISTPMGEAGIGIIRVSGKEAFKIAKKIFKPARDCNWGKIKGKRLVYGHVYDLKNNKVIDEILLGVMRAPYTYTREDIIEFNCHGGVVPLRKTLELILKHGARLAEPGEFTKRAFLNGRLDLTQAESIIDVIRSKTETGLDIALNQLQGKLSEEINELKTSLLDLLAHIEVNIDFSEDNLGEATYTQLNEKATFVLNRLEKLLEGANVGKVYREGVHTVIVGKPNVGKSSLLNALLREKRAIVTEIPGTTRDTIEEVLNIRGIPLRLVDTAGLRKTDDVIEKMGVERSREMAKKADLILMVLDISNDLTDEDIDIMKIIIQKKGVVILNKSDVGKKEVNEYKIRELLPRWPVVEISALKEHGLNNLEKVIEKVILEGVTISSNSILISNVRHKEVLERTAIYLRNVIKDMENEVPVDLLSIDIRSALETLGELTGETINEDLVERIFSDFCIGK